MWHIDWSAVNGSHLNKYNYICYTGAVTIQTPLSNRCFLYCLLNAQKNSKSLIETGILSHIPADLCWIDFWAYVESSSTGTIDAPVLQTRRTGRWLVSLEKWDAMVGIGSRAFLDLKINFPYSKVKVWSIFRILKYLYIGNEMKWNDKKNEMMERFI